MEWMIFTAGLRLDYNTMTDTFVSPRASIVLTPATDQFFRVGIAKAFRKPTFYETLFHLRLDFPKDSPITGTQKDEFQEFMLRVAGNTALNNEGLLSYELGYRGEFFDKKLSTNLELFWNQYQDVIFTVQRIFPSQLHLPDLERSSFLLENAVLQFDIYGIELNVRIDVSRSFSFWASWSYKRVFDNQESDSYDHGPQHLAGIGACYLSQWGLVTSLNTFYRSAFWDEKVFSDSGMLEPPRRVYLDHALLLLGRLGWRSAIADTFDMEIGMKIFLPISLSAEASFGYRDLGGGIGSMGTPYGGEEVNRMVIFYLQGEI